MRTHLQERVHPVGQGRVVPRGASPNNILESPRRPSGNDAGRRVTATRTSRTNKIFEFPTKTACTLRGQRGKTAGARPRRGMAGLVKLFSVRARSSDSETAFARTR